MPHDRILQLPSFLRLPLSSIFASFLSTPFCLLLIFSNFTAHGQVLFLNTTVVPNITWRPAGLGQFRVGDERTVWMLVDSNETAWSGPVEISCELALGCPLEECSIVHQVQLDKSSGFSQSVNISLKGSFVGLNRLFARIGRKQFWYRVRTWKTHLGSQITAIFTVALGIGLFAGNFMAGLQLDPRLLVKYPKPLLVVALCQFLIVPMMGYCMAKYLLLNDRPFVTRLALFLVTCTPAGAGKSAFWSVLFDGNLELVAALAFLQRIGTFVFMPLWLHLFGRRAFFVDRVRISLSALGYGLALMMVPFLLGMLLASIGAREFLQRGANFLKFFFWFATALFLAIAVPAVWPNLRLLTWDLLLTIGLLLPCAAHLVAFLLAKAFRLSPRDGRTVTIECGIQASGLSALILLLSLGEPERDVALAVPMAIALLTDKPLLALCMGRIGHRALAILKGATEQQDKVAPAEQQPNGDGLLHQSSISTAMATSSRQIAGLLEQKLVRVKQVDELVVVGGIGRGMPPPTTTRSSSPSSPTMRRKMMFR